MEKIVKVGYGLKIVLDQREIFPDDPGMGTPAMVYHLKSGASATWWCCSDTGEIEGYDLNQAQLDYLRSLEDFVNGKVDAWYNLAEKAK